MGKGAQIARVVDSAFGGTLTKAGVFGDGMSDGPKGPPKTPDALKQATDIPKEELAARRTGLKSASAPVFLGLSSQMTPQQQRTAIATNAVSGSGSGTDPEALSFYRQLALQSLVDDKGQFADYSQITPIELEYMSRLGKTPRKPTTESYLSALEEALNSQG